MTDAKTPTDEQQNEGIPPICKDCATWIKCEGSNQEDCVRSAPQVDDGLLSQIEELLEIFMRGYGEGFRNKELTAQQILAKCEAKHRAEIEGLINPLKELIRRDDYGSIRLPTQAREVIKEALKSKHMKEESNG